VTGYQWFQISQAFLSTFGALQIVFASRFDDEVQVTVCPKKTPHQALIKVWL
jgi:hypothetical protein